MPGESEKQRRKALRNQLRLQSRAKAEAECPISLVQLHQLFDHLDQQLENHPCRETFELTSRFLQQLKLDERTILAWLRQYGGYCDCEVLANLEEHWPRED